jgi:hypothetical protein
MDAAPALGRASGAAAPGPQAVRAPFYVYGVEVAKPSPVYGCRSSMFILKTE